MMFGKKKNAEPCDVKIVLRSLNTMLEHCNRISDYREQIDGENGKDDDRISEDAIAFRLILMSVVSNEISDWLSKNSDYDWDIVKGFECMYLDTDGNRSDIVMDMVDNHVPRIREEIGVLIEKASR